MVDEDRLPPAQHGDRNAHEQSRHTDRYQQIHRDALARADVMNVSGGDQHPNDLQGREVRDLEHDEHRERQMPLRGPRLATDV
jgi:hypothetical protein